MDILGIVTQLNIIHFYVKAKSKEGLLEADVKLSKLIKDIKKYYKEEFEIKKCKACYEELEDDWIICPYCTSEIINGNR